MARWEDERHLWVRVQWRPWGARLALSTRLVVRPDQRGSSRRTILTRTVNLSNNITSAALDNRASGSEGCMYRQQRRVCSRRLRRSSRSSSKGTEQLVLVLARLGCRIGLVLFQDLQGEVFRLDRRRG